VPEAFVVGGAVRDPLLGRATPVDLDLAVMGDGFAVARQVASAYGKGATFVPLDRSTGTGRVVLWDEVRATLDIASFKGPTLREDLFGRDFTINALALSIPDFLDGAFHRVIDPTGGVDDLKKGLIRACHEDAFQSDPLRILRAFRFRASLGFRMSPETGALMAARVPDLPHVSPERIRDELFAILSTGEVAATLWEMDAMGVLAVVFPETDAMKGCQQNRYHHLDVWGHTMEAMRRLEEIEHAPWLLLGELAEQVAAYLSEELVPTRNKAALLALAMLFHDAGKPQAMIVDQSGGIRFFGHEKISRDLFTIAGNRLKLARREIKLVGDWIGGHMRTMIFTGPSVSARAIFRLHQTYDKDLAGLLLLFLADLAASRGPARDPGAFQLALGRCKAALHRSFVAREAQAIPLLNGRDIMDAFGLAPGPGLGALLGKIRELQGTGEIRTREDALEAVSRLLEEVPPEGGAEKPKAR